MYIWKLRYAVACYPYRGGVVQATRKHHFMAKCTLSLSASSGSPVSRSIGGGGLWGLARALDVPSATVAIFRSPSLCGRTRNCKNLLRTFPLLLFDPWNGDFRPHDLHVMVQKLIVFVSISVVCLSASPLHSYYVLPMYMHIWTFPRWFEGFCSFTLSVYTLSRSTVVLLT